MLIYICTVGTGTAGNTSNVSMGILHSIEMKKTNVVLLIPSENKNSIAAAEIVKDGIKENSVKDMCRETYISPISDCDNLIDTRNEIKEILS